MADDDGARVRDWVQIIRMARIGRTTKAVAFALAHYADADGTRVFPSIARLSVECELSYNSVKASLAELRKAQLLKVVRHGAQRGESNHYRLIIGPNVMDLIDVLSPNDITLMIEKLSAAHRRPYEPRAPKGPQPTGRAVHESAESDVQPTGQAVAAVDNPVDESPVQPSAQAVQPTAPETCTAHGACADSTCTAHGTGFVQPTPWAATTQRPTTTTTNHKTADVEVTVTVPSPNGRDPNRDFHSEVNPRRGRHAAPDEVEPETTNVIAFRRPA